MNEFWKELVERAVKYDHFRRRSQFSKKIAMYSHRDVFSSKKNFRFY
jgi:N-glycosylase/DNA lyase